MTIPRPDAVAAVAGRVRALRDSRGWRQADLAERMRAQGFDSWSRTTVFKLETGQRASLSVDELLGLALIFDLPPVLLIADPRDGRDLKVARDVTVSGWDGLLWLIGAVGPSAGQSVDSWLVQAGWTIVEALGELGREQIHPDPEVGRERTAEKHREALGRLRVALTRAETLGAPYPELPGDVYKRAAELGVDLLPRKA